jgi:hypothetical protein
MKVPDIHIDMLITITMAMTGRRRRKPTGFGKAKALWTFYPEFLAERRISYGGANRSSFFEKGGEKWIPASLPAVATALQAGAGMTPATR